MSSPSKIYFFHEKAVTLKDRTRLKQFIEKVFKKEGRALESLNYIFCSDKRLLAINREYLQHDYYTDIISFELSPPQEPIIAEIYISIDRVRDNSSLLNQSFTRELHRVIFHGALHLCGYSDKTLKEEQKMREKEDQYLGSYFKG